MIKGIASDVVEIVEPAKSGYQLTLRIDFTKIPRKKGILIYPQPQRKLFFLL